MIKQINTILQSILFSWIVFLGVIYAQTNHSSFETNICIDKYSLDSTDSERSLSPLIIAHNNILYSDSHHVSETCCHDQPCEHQKQILYSSKQPESKTHFKHISDESSTAYNKRKNAAPAPGKFINLPAPPIYIMTQSFLC